MTSDAKERRPARARVAGSFLSVAGGVVFSAALVGAAIWGAAAARRDLPESARQSIGYPLGVVVTLTAETQPLYLAPDVRSLRDYFFAFQTPDERRAGDAEARGLRRIFSPIEVRTLRRDADGIEVVVLTGALSGKVYWVHVSQLPDLSPPDSGADSASSPGQ